MESSSKFYLAGGITRVVMHLASAPLPDIDSEEPSIVFEPEVGRASYNELCGLASGQRFVTHTLTYSVEHDENPIGEELLEEALREGVVADITLATGATIRVGWSSQFGVEQPLRLVSSQFESGEKLSDYPLKKWVWQSKDCSNLI